MSHTKIKIVKNEWKTRVHVWSNVTWMCISFFEVRFNFLNVKSISHSWHRRCLNDFLISRLYLICYKSSSKTCCHASRVRGWSFAGELIRERTIRCVKCYIAITTRAFHVVGWRSWIVMKRTKDIWKRCIIKFAKSYSDARFHNDRPIKRSEDTASMFGCAASETGRSILHEQNEAIILLSPNNLRIYKYRMLGCARASMPGAGSVIFERTVSARGTKGYKSATAREPRVFTFVMHKPGSNIRIINRAMHFTWNITRCVPNRLILGMVNDAGVFLFLQTLFNISILSFSINYETYNETRKIVNYNHLFVPAIP